MPETGYTECPHCGDDAVNTNVDGSSEDTVECASCHSPLRLSWLHLSQWTTTDSYKYASTAHFLPDVYSGDEVRVTYETRRSDRTQTRIGEVTRVHVNGFVFDHYSGDSNLRTGVRVHQNTITDNREFDIKISTLSERGTTGTFGHASNLNRGHRSPKEVTVELND